MHSNYPSFSGFFSKPEYTAILNELSQKEDHQALKLNKQSIKRASLIDCVWQRVKGWIGLDNQINPVKVNYQLINIIYYGKTHHYLDDDETKKLLKNSRKKNSQNK